MPKAKKPEPVVVNEVCSMCGLDWKLHKQDPTAEGCIELLKAELARRPLWTPHWQTWQPQKEIIGKELKWPEKPKWNIVTHESS